MNIGVTILGIGSGFSYNDSGPTHHSTEDISAMRALPNMTIVNLSDARMTEKFAEISYKMSGPCYIRLDKEPLPAIYAKDEEFFDGLTNLKTGKDLCIIATGNMVHRAFEVVKRLSKYSIDAGIIDLYRIKPINSKRLLEYIKHTKQIVTLEEHLLAGGMGSAVIEVLIDGGINLPIKRIGIVDKYYYSYGSRNDVQSTCGLDPETITKSILKWLNIKQDK